MVEEKTPKQVIITRGDEVAKRNIGISKSNAHFEEKVIQLSGFNSLLELTPDTSPDQRAHIHALNHLLDDHENITPTKFNHALILLSLESVSFQTASTSPKNCYGSPSMSSMLFDHPFNLQLVSKDTSVVPVSALSNITELPRKPTSYTLQLGEVHRNLEDYSVLEMFGTNGLLQELIAMQFTHPYIEVFEHRHSESIVLVLHTGFDGSPSHKHQIASHTHTRVGFQNYLQYVAERYSHLIDEAVEEDLLRKKDYDEEKQATVARKLKEIQEKQGEMLPPLEEEEHASDSGKGNKKAESLPQKHSVQKADLKKSVSSIDTSQTSSSNANIAAIEAGLPPFEKEKRFTGYDMGDVVLLKKSTHTTLFTGDGVQVQCKRHLAIDGAPAPCEVTLLHNGHRVVCNQVLMPEDFDRSNTKRSGIFSHPRTPQPPPKLSCASLQACFNGYLQISCSQFGPKGNGELPYLPHRPKILDSPLSVELLPGLHPNQPGISPKLSKKQQEHQQQLLEQQRLLEAQAEKERQAAKAKYQEEYDVLVRNNRCQQLYITTAFGLEASCQIVFDSHTDASCADEDGTKSFVVVRQKYSFPDTALQLNEHVSKEVSRVYHPEGFVIKYMKDSSVIILSADGTKYRSASSKEIELFHQCKSGSMGGMNQERDDLEKGGKRTPSANRVKFIENIEKSSSPAIITEGQKIWVVTTPAGKCYLLQQTEETKKEAAVVEEASPDLENKKDADTARSPIDVKKKSVIVPQTSIHFLKATDPISKEVSSTEC